MSAPPITFQWDEAAGAMRVVQHYAREAARRFKDGARYRLEEASDEASDESRGHYFACLKEAHDNLTDEQRARWPTVTHLRKYALCKTGYADQKSIVCETQAQALRLAAVIAPMDPFAVVVPSGTTVTVYTAKSQKKAAMGSAKAFQASKVAVLDYVARLIGVDAETLTTITGTHA